MKRFQDKKRLIAFTLMLVIALLFSLFSVLMITKGNRQENDSVICVNDHKKGVRIVPELTEDSCRIYLPSGFSLADLKLMKGDRVIEEDLVSAEKKKRLQIDGREYRLEIIRMDEVPTLFIDVKTGDIDKVNADAYKKEKARALLQVLDENGDFDLQEYASIKGRGNTSWRFYDKKPYNIRFDSDVKILGMEADEHWVLLANGADGLEIDNALVYDFGRQLSLSYVPDHRYINVYIDGKYNGLYLLCEKIEVSKSRLDLKRDASYLLEIDLNATSDLLDHYFISEGNNLVEVHYPEAVNSSYLEKIESEVNAFENALQDLSSDRWKEMIDIDSFARVYLIDELFENVDGGYCSVFLYKDDEGKLVRGPIWDYDRCFGYGTRLIMAGNARKYGNQISDSYNYWLLKRNEFKERVKEIYEEEFIPLLENYAYARISEIEEQIEASYKADCLVWDTKELTGLSDTIQTFLESRSAFLKDYFENEENYVKVQIEDEFHYLNNFILEKGRSIYEAYDLNEDLLDVTLYDMESGEVFDSRSLISEDLTLVRGGTYEHELPDLRVVKEQNIGFFNIIFAVVFLFCFGASVHIIKKRIKDGKVSS